MSDVRADIGTVVRNATLVSDVSADSDTVVRNATLGATYNTCGALIDF